MESILRPKPTCQPAQAVHGRKAQHMHIGRAAAQRLNNLACTSRTHPCLWRAQVLLMIYRISLDSRVAAAGACFVMLVLPSTGTLTHVVQEREACAHDDKEAGGQQPIVQRHQALCQARPCEVVLRLMVELLLKAIFWAF